MSEYMSEHERSRKERILIIYKFLYLSGQAEISVPCVRVCVRACVCNMVIV